MRHRIIFAVILLYVFCALPVHGRDYSGKTFYFIVIDRFNDGDSSNNKEDRLFSRDRSDWRLYWGGDFKGITKHVGYLKALGITGLWITPVVKNTNYLYDYGSFALSAYHGYWACDFREINDRFGTREELKELLTACRKEGILVILDIVVNHTSPIGKGADGALFDRGRLVTSYSKDHEGIFHHNKGIDHRKPYDPLIWDACNLFDLADLNQDNDFVNKYLRDSYKEWLSMGFDGLRIDTATYVKTSWLSSFVEDMRRAYPEIYVVGEWNKGGSDVPEAVNFERESSIHLLDFRLQYELSSVFNENKSFTRITDLLAHDSKLTDPYQTMTFLDNHDMPRFLSKAIADGADEKEARQRLEAATCLLLTMRGIPCIYYGTEQYLHNEGKSGWGIGSDPYCRPMMSSFDENGGYFRNIQKLANLRKSNGALSRGRTETLLVTDDIYAFCRKHERQMVVTAVNKGKRSTFTVAVDAPSGTYSSTTGPDLSIKDGQAAITLNRHEVMVTPLVLPEHGSLQGSQKQRDSTLPSTSPDAPVMEGRISEFVQNPAKRLIAVSAVQSRGDSCRTAIVFFDWSNLRIVSSTTVNEHLQKLCWSPDGKYLAAIGEKPGITLFTAQGAIRHISTSRQVTQFRWSTKKPTTIYYITDEKSDRIMELSTVNNRDSEIRKAADLISLFEVKGAMWYARRVKGEKTEDFYGDVEACDLATGTRRFFLPLYGRAWDYRYLEVSPCGRYFFFSGMASSGTLNVVARRVDASLIFKKPYLSIMFQYGFEDLYSILWPGKRMAGNQYHEDDAVLQPSDDPSFFLDLSSGSRGKIAEIPFSKSDGAFLLTAEGLVMRMPTNETKLLLCMKPGQ